MLVVELHQRDGDSHHFQRSKVIPDVCAMYRNARIPEKIRDFVVSNVKFHDWRSTQARHQNIARRLIVPEGRIPRLGWSGRAKFHLGLVAARRATKQALLRITRLCKQRPSWSTIIEAKCLRGSCRHKAKVKLGPTGPFGALIERDPGAGPFFLAFARKEWKTASKNLENGQLSAEAFSFEAVA